MADLHNVLIQAENDGISATCKLCSGRKRWRSEEVNLALVVDDMTDHLERNHPTSP